VSGAVAASLAGLAGALRRFFAAGDAAEADGLLQRRDPRVAVLAVTGFAAAVVLARQPAVTLALAAVTLVLAWLSAVSLRRLVARSAAVVLVSALVVLPQAVLLPGETLVRVGGLAVTDAGVVYVAWFTLRVGVGVGLLSVLVLTTPFSAVVAGLRGLGVPAALVWVLAVTYRYLFLLFDELRRLLLARNSRTRATGLRAGWRDARRLAGTFLLRALDRGERVGRGMRARGGARPPSPYRRTTELDRGDLLLLAAAAGAVVCAGVLRWAP
jgi:cobalt/nickel transport system permease protein